MSNSPVSIFVNDSSEVLNVVTLTSQPVSSSKGVTQSAFLLTTAVLDVAGPRQDAHLSFVLTDLLCCLEVGHGLRTT